MRATELGSKTAYCKAIEPGMKVAITSETPSRWQQLPLPDVHLQTTSTPSAKPSLQRTPQIIYQINRKP